MAPAGRGQTQSVIGPYGQTTAEACPRGWLLRSQVATSYLLPQLPPLFIGGVVSCDHLGSAETSYLQTPLQRRRRTTRTPSWAIKTERRRPTDYVIFGVGVFLVLAWSLFSHLARGNAGQFSNFVFSVPDGGCEAPCRLFRKRSLKNDGLRAKSHILARFIAFPRTVLCEMLAVFRRTVFADTLPF